MGRCGSGACRALLEEPVPSAIGFYTTGQLFCEEYYTLATIARAGIGTNHLDGNTRLCTATAGEALKETFGCDGQPGSYDDVDPRDVIALCGPQHRRDPARAVDAHAATGWPGPTRRGCVVRRPAPTPVPAPSAPTCIWHRGRARTSR